MRKERLRKMINLWSLTMGEDLNEKQVFFLLAQFKLLGLWQCLFNKSVFVQL